MPGGDGVHLLLGVTGVFPSWRCLPDVGCVLDWKNISELVATCRGKAPFAGTRCERLGTLGLMNSSSNSDGGRISKSNSVMGLVQEWGQTAAELGRLSRRTDFLASFDGDHWGCVGIVRLLVVVVVVMVEEDVVSLILDKTVVSREHRDKQRNKRRC